MYRVYDFLGGVGRVLVKVVYAFMGLFFSFVAAIGVGLEPEVTEGAPRASSFLQVALLVVLLYAIGAWTTRGVLYWLRAATAFGVAMVTWAFTGEESFRLAFVHALDEAGRTELSGYA